MEDNTLNQGNAEHGKKVGLKKALSKIAGVAGVVAIVAGTFVALKGKSSDKTTSEN